MVFQGLKLKKCWVLGANIDKSPEQIQRTVYIYLTQLCLFIFDPPMDSNNPAFLRM